MANAVKGAVEVHVENRSYTVVYDFNALCELEDEFGVPAAALSEILKEGRAKSLRTVFRIGLSRHHPEITDATAGDIIGEIGAAELGRVITEAFRRAAPDPEAKSVGKRPPRAKI